MREAVYTYKIDADDRIIEVDENWLEFAKANHTPELLDGSVIGQSIWRYIADTETRHLYQVMLDNVRMTQRNVSVPFRGDSPDCKRFMELKLSSLPGKAVLFTSTLVEAAPQAYMPLFDVTRERTSDSVQICSWCKAVKVSMQDWYNADEAVVALKLFGEDVMPEVEHSMCPSCTDHFHGVVGQYFEDEELPIT